MTDSWHIRCFALPEDLAQVLSFQRETYELNFPGFIWSTEFLDEFERTLRRAHHSPNEGLFVAQSAAGETVGFVWVGVSVRHFERDRYVGVIRDIYVAPSHRQQGLGKALIRQAEQFAISRGATKMTLEVTLSNAAAVCLYEGAGYQVERLQMAKQLCPPPKTGTR